MLSTVMTSTLREKRLMISFERLPLCAVRADKEQDDGEKGESCQFASDRAQCRWVDIGTTQIFVAVAPDRDAEPVRCFDTFTVELEKLADWLQQCQIRTVAMESTGVCFALSSALIGRVQVPPALG